ncbi:MAG TPA: hypothetical protein VGK67_27830 [Myxococcales bacterium]|jgi:hypothetical protein
MTSRLSILLLLLLGSCSSATGNGPQGTSATKPGLQYSGAIATHALGQISAPLLPDMIVWQYKGGSGYPASTAEAVALVRDTTYTYGFLLTVCARTHPEITLSTDPSALTAEQLRANYDHVARCAYEEYGAKPYWMPQILNDVDVCALKLGAGWRLLSEADLDAFSEEDFLLFKNTMTGESADGFTQFYFSLNAYARARDGSIRWADLNPGAIHLRALPLTYGGMKDLLVEPAIGVRCMHQP